MKRLALLTLALAAGLMLTRWVVMAMSSAAVTGPGEQAEVWLTTVQQKDVTDNSIHRQ